MFTLDPHTGNLMDIRTVAASVEEVVRMRNLTPASTLYHSARELDIEVLRSYLFLEPFAYLTSTPSSLEFTEAQ
jgi:hypothetical protein